MNKDFRLILNLASAVGARMPATGAAFAVNAMLSGSRQDQDFSAVILQMEKQAQRDFGDETQTRTSIASLGK